MSDLRSFVILQAKLYVFLEQQDEMTLQSIVDGTAQLSVVPGDDARASVSSESVRVPPSNDPLQVAQHLSRLTSERERQIYLNGTGLKVSGLRTVAKLRGLSGYSKLTRAGLINTLTGDDLRQVEAPVTVRTPPASADLAAVGQPEPEQQPTPQAARPPVAPTSSGTTKPNAEITAIASRLRETETVEEGAAYLHEQRFDRETLLAVAAELQLTRVHRLNQTELEKRVLKQAIGARRKFAGLREW